MNNFKTIIKSSPFIIAIIYMLAGFLWITYSDQIVFSLFEDTAAITQVQSIKGWFYVIASGVLIFFLVQKSNDIIERLAQEGKQDRNKFESTVEYAPIGIAHHKPDENWIHVNKALCNLLGYKKDELLKINFEDFIHPDDLEKGRKLDQNLIEGQISSYKMEKRYRRKNGSYFIGKMTKSVVFDENDKPLYLIATVEDISDQKENEEKLKNSIQEKEILLSEVHHRVKNNLALMSALLELQLMHTKNRDVSEVLEHYKTRLKTLSLIYENFSAEENEPMIDFSWYLDQQIDYAKQIFSEKNRSIHYKKEIEKIGLNINQAIPVGLICNELLINTNHHDFKDAVNPFIKISMQSNGDSILFTIQNNGIMKNKLFDLSDPQSLDSRIIDALTKQVKGEVSHFSENNLNTYKLIFRKGTWRGAASYIHPEAV